MDFDISIVQNGTVTTPGGFVAGAVAAGIKYQGRLDLGILCAEKPGAAAALFTSNRVKSAPVVFSQRWPRPLKAQAIVVNSGCANACTGNEGLLNAATMASLAARRLGIESRMMLVCSTGVIGVQMPMNKVRTGISRITLSREGGRDLARAMMTTDTFPKEVAVSVVSGAGRFAVGGVAKGSGMIHPNMATMLAFLTTDADVSSAVLRRALKRATAVSFNMISVDGDTSPSDTVAVLASCKSGVKIGVSLLPAFDEALTMACIHLAKAIAGDGEGATRLIEVIVEGARTERDARQVARTVTTSPLVKAAVHGADPNWGRVVAAVGRSGVEVDESKLDVWLSEIPVMSRGVAGSFSKDKAVESLRKKEVVIRVGLNLGSGRAVAWGCDLSREYVSINADYTT